MDSCRAAAPRSSGDGGARPRVLLADDNAGLAELLSYVLSDAGNDVVVAHSGREALAAASLSPCDVAVLDLQLPDLGGLDVFLELRERSPHIQSIIITGHASLESAIEALDRGAYSYLTKPVSGDVLRVQVARALERRRLLCERETHLLELEAAYQRERRIAETLQRCILSEVPTSLPGIALEHRYVPALGEAEVGGDFYDVFPLGERRVGLVIGDVSGKGLEAARHTALAKYLLYGYAVEDPAPERVLARLNQALVRRSGYDVFVTLFFGVLETGTGRLVYVNAGHEPMLLRQACTGAIERLESTAPPAGAFPDADYRAAATTVHPSDLLLLYTDGATDARRGDRWLGTQGIERLLRENAGSELKQALDGIYDGVMEFAGSRPRDDIALLMLARSE